MCQRFTYATYLYTSARLKLELRGHPHNSVVHMRDQKNAKKGVKMRLFLRKRVLLDSIKGCLGVIFETSSNPKKACLGVILGQNYAKFSFRGCFPWRGEIAIRVCFENLWSHMCTTLVLPPPLSPSPKSKPSKSANTLLVVVQSAD